MHRVYRLNADHGGSAVDQTTYLYNGTARVMKTSLVGSSPDITSTASLDRFGHTSVKEWKTSSTLDKFTYGYDYASNRTSRDISANNTFDHTYSYDGGHRLESYNEAGSAEQSWELDTWGNWSKYTYNSNADTQTRDHNLANETGTIAADTGEPASTNWGDPAHDSAGNMTTMPDPAALTSTVTATYDAWNRLVTVGSNTYRYDGLHRRIIKDPASGSDEHYFYNEGWQCLEMRTVSEGGTKKAAYVWHPYYIDALAVRYWDSNDDNDYIDANEIEYVMQDANFNVTSLASSSGSVIERYHYSAYGVLTVLLADWSTDSDNVSDFENPYTYTGRRFDGETGLYYYRNRYFHAQLGRFLSRDPIGYEGSQWSLYEYVNGRPVVALDPMGRQSFIPGPTVNGTTHPWILPGTHVPGHPHSSPPVVRPLTPGEISFLNSVFGGHLDTSGLQVGMTGLTPFHTQTTVTPGQIPWFPQSHYSPDFSMAIGWKRQLFIHEMVHVLQDQQGHSNVWNAAKTWVANWFNYNAAYLYDPNDLGKKPLWEFNLEQQAEIISQHATGNLPVGASPQAAAQTIGNCQTTKPRPPKPKQPYIPPMKSRYPCFRGDTQVWTPDGLKRIDQVKCGEQVVSRDSATGLIVTSLVRNVERHKGSFSLNELAINTEKIHVTDGHPILLNGRWVLSHELRSCQPCRTVTGNHDLSRRTSVLKSPVVFNLITDKGTYIVGESGLVVSGLTRPSHIARMLIENARLTRSRSTQLGPWTKKAEKVRQRVVVIRSPIHSLPISVDTVEGFRSDVGGWLYLNKAE